MINNDTNRPMTTAERIARFSAATPTITPNTRPADRSRNGLRTPRSVKHKGLR
jgi:hypothetical protein